LPAHRPDKENSMKIVTTLLAAVLVAVAGTAAAQAPAKPNIVVLWGDDIGQFNVSAYNNGMMGYRTPNIDSIAREGALFTDWYGQQSCTAGRAAFITGQSPIRTGLTKVGLPGTPEGMKREDPTIATLLKAQGYLTGQFGKNHLGDRDDMLPTAHGFDEFFGNLYHLNAEEEPEHEDYPSAEEAPLLRKALLPVYPELSDMRLVDFKVRILNGGTGATTRVLIESRDKKGNRWFTVGVSPNIVDASFQALSDALVYKLVREGVTAD